jgi:hypothetical protein
VASVSVAVFEAEVKDRFGILPNFFRSAQAAPDLIQQLWSFAKAGYLDSSARLDWGGWGRAA